MLCALDFHKGVVDDLPISPIAMAFIDTDRSVPVPRNAVPYSWNEAMQRCVYPLSLVEMNSVSLIVARFRMFLMNRM